MWHTYGILLFVEQLTVFMSSRWHFWKKCWAVKIWPPLSWNTCADISISLSLSLIGEQKPFLLSAIMVLSLSVFLFICLSVCLFICLSVCLFVCLFVCLSVCLAVCLSVCLPVCLFACLFVCLCVNRLIFLRTRLLCLFYVKISVSRSFIGSAGSKIFSTYASNWKLKDSENAFFQSTIRKETQKMSNVFLPCFCFFVQLKAKSCERKRKNSLQLPSWWCTAEMNIWPDNKTRFAKTS